MHAGGRGGPASYAVLWQDRESEVCSGALTLAQNALRLEGTDRQGTPRSIEIRAYAVQGVRIGRASRERIDGRPALVLRLAPDHRLLIVSAVGLGMIHEMADRLASAGFMLEPTP